MKKIILILCLCATCAALPAQDSTQATRYKNEFGIDATGFLKQFVYLNGTQFPEYYTPVYYLTYRRHIGKCNLRAAIGGLVFHQPFDSPYGTGDPNSYEHSNVQVDARIGWEWTNELSRRWQVFYGADYRQGFIHDKNDAPYWNGGYAYGRETTFLSYGVAPLLGFRFRLTERLSLATEASFGFYLSTSETRKYYQPVSPQYPPMPDELSPKYRSYRTSFAQPLSVFITFDI
jgi:hypothetical protein